MVGLLSNFDSVMVFNMILICYSELELYAFKHLVYAVVYFGDCLR